MKIYTGTGDKGKTSLFSGERIAKDDIRVEAYGTVDELCSFIGAVCSHLPEFDEKARCIEELYMIQADLFVIGALLATSTGSDDAQLLKPLDQDRVTWLENRIDRIEGELEQLRSFLLPGGHPAAAWCHVVRTICRRTERGIVSLAGGEDGFEAEIILGYINRLSDYFFVFARYLNKAAGVEENIWHG